MAIKSNNVGDNSSNDTVVIMTWTGLVVVILFAWFFISVYRDQEAEFAQGLTKIATVDCLSFKDKVSQSQEPCLIWVYGSRSEQGLFVANRHLKSMLAVMFRQSGPVKFFRLDKHQNPTLVWQLFDGKVDQLNGSDGFVIVRKGRVTARLVLRGRVDAVQLEHFIQMESDQNR